jgi:hypothetical protein
MKYIIKCESRRKTNMANLLYYRTEKVIYKEAFDRTLTIDSAEIVFKKLVRHYKLGNVYLVWSSGNRRPKAYGDYKIILNRDWNNFGVLIHELSHIIHKKRLNKSGHNKRHLRFMKSMVTYCTRKNWFQEEIEKRLAPKPIEPKVSEISIVENELIEIESKLKRYYSKLKFYNNKIKKNERKLRRLKKRLQKRD